MTSKDAAVAPDAWGRQRTALLSVADKSGILDLARALQVHSWEIFATGGTYELLRSRGLVARPAEALAGDGEVLGGRVKTLDRSIFCGLLYRRDGQRDTEDMAARGYRPISLIACHPPVLPRGWNWIDRVDVGGPAMLRAAAKNHASVIALCEPSQYREAADALAAEDGGLGDASLPWRRRLAAAVFERLSEYDRRIAAGFIDPLQENESA
jgi:phosphoribosylaminoimidazolecarboxamide formyltransferase/IMP cyclohydrolase